MLGFSLEFRVPTYGQFRVSPHQGPAMSVAVIDLPPDGQGCHGGDCGETPCGGGVVGGGATDEEVREGPPEFGGHGVVQDGIDSAGIE